MEWLLSALFPRFCVGCKTEGKLLCGQCRALWWHDPPSPSLDHLAPYAYANPTVRQLICAWKYHYDHSAWQLLREHAQPFLSALKEEVRKREVQAIVPLPLSGHRERERGFNQSLLIAQWLSTELALPVAPMLVRAHRWGHQADRSPEERAEAMKETPFAVRKGQNMPSSILLVDDVWTTGATMEAAKKSLKQAGISRILAFTLAKG